MAADWTSLPVPQQVFEEEIEYNTLITQAEDGTERRRRKWASGRERRVFTLVYNALTKTNKDLIMNHYISREGNYLTFTFNNPNDSTNYTVRFLDRFRFTYIGHNGTEGLYQIPSFRLIEVW